MSRRAKLGAGKPRRKHAKRYSPADVARRTAQIERERWKILARKSE